MHQSSPTGSLVLLYHRMGSVFVRSTVRGQYVLPAVLRVQLRSLLGKGYRPASIAELFAQPGVPGRFAVTFDDGYTSVQQQACPILREMGIPVTIFAVAGLLGRSNEWDQRLGDRYEPLMDAAALHDLAAAGVEIGSHTLTHANLLQLSDADLRAEVRDSKHVLEDVLGRPVHGFSYPYGACDARVRAAAIEAGYRYATATTIGMFTAVTDPFSIPRINMRWNTFGIELQQKITRAKRAAIHKITL